LQNSLIAHTAAPEKGMTESDTDGSDETKIVPARNRYSFKKKAEIVEKVHAAQEVLKAKGVKRTRSQAIDRVSESTGIPAQTIVRWMKVKDAIQNQAGEKQSSTKKARFNRIWLKDLRNLEEVLAREIRKRRKLGLSLYNFALAKR
jgi:hypothetical protein